MTPWEGTVTVKVTAKFTFEVDKSWEAVDETEARYQVEGELTHYLGDAWLDQRFDEDWATEERTN